MARIAVALLALALASCAGPDEFSIGYGRIFQGDSRLGEPHGGGWPIDNDDSDIVTADFTWHLRPRRVVVENTITPPLRWQLEPLLPTAAPVTPATPVEEPEPDPEPTKPPELVDDDPGGLPAARRAARMFDSLDWLTRVLLVITVCWLGWVYREKLGRMIPARWRNGNGKKADGKNPSG